MRRSRSCLITLLAAGGSLIILLVVVIVLLLWQGGVWPFVGGQRVAIIRLEGVISAPDSVVEALERYGKDTRVRAMVLRIDTPGGAVGPTQEIYEAVRSWNQTKKIVASLGSIATSGGYYVACGAEQILANPGTITGSIGVIVGFTNLEKLLAKVGVQGEVIKSGAHKDMGSPLRSLTPEERALLQGVIDDVYDQFVEAIAESRNLPEDQIRSIADGRVFSGRQAQKLGLTDGLGGLQDAIRLAARLGGIAGEPQVVEEPERSFSLLKLLLGKTMGELATSAAPGIPSFAYLFHP